MYLSLNIVPHRRTFFTNIYPTPRISKYT